MPFTAVPYRRTQNSTSAKSGAQAAVKHPPGYHPTLFRQRFLVTGLAGLRKLFEYEISAYLHFAIVFSTAPLGLFSFSISLQPTYLPATA